MRTGIVAFLAGNMALLYWPYFPNRFFISALAGVVIILIWLLYKPGKQSGYFYPVPAFLIKKNRIVKQTIHKSMDTAIVLCLGFCLGVLWTALYIVWHQSDLDLAQPEGQTLRVLGEIVSLPHKNDQRTRFEFKIFGKVQDLSANSQSADNIKLDKSFAGIVRLSWYASHQILYSGQIWLLDVRLKTNNGLMNPGGFDYEQWLFQNRIHATGYVRQGWLQSKSSGYSLSRLLSQGRQALSVQLDKVLQNNPYKGLIKALAIGSKVEINPRHWQLLFSTGTNHLVAISGLHIGLLATVSGFLVLTLWKRCYYPGLKVPAIKVAGIAGLFAAFFYAALAGFAIPTQRALIMLIVVTIALISGRQYSPYSVLLYALLVVLMLDPLSSLSAGFWLSFGAVAVILLSMSARLGGTYQSLKNNRMVKMSGFIKLQGRLFIGLLPLMVLLFHQFSISSPVANLVAVPLMSLLIVPVTLFASLLSIFNIHWSEWLFDVLVYPFDTLFWFLNLLSNGAHSLYNIPGLSYLSIFLLLIGSVWLLMPHGWTARWLGLLLFLPLFFINSERPKEGELRLSVLDVGQGLAMVVQTRAHTLVYDTGDNYSSQFNMAHSVIIPFLRHHGVTQVDRLIISHTDRDHVGSFTPLLEGIPVSGVISGEAQAEHFEGNQVIQCHRGQYWHWDGVRFEFLSPEMLNVEKNNNNLSCVLLITTMDKTRYLLTGDIEKKVEVQLLRNYPELRVDILQVPHHGSKTSSSHRFVNQLQPQIAVFSYGYQNRFRHPSKQVVRRYITKDVKIYTTTNGTIDIQRNITNNSISVTQYRLQNQRFWHRPAEQL